MISFGTRSGPITLLLPGDHSLDDILKFSNIAWPVILLKVSDHAGSTDNVTPTYDCFLQEVAQD